MDFMRAIQILHFSNRDAWIGYHQTAIYYTFIDKDSDGDQENCNSRARSIKRNRKNQESGVYLRLPKNGGRVG
jgi:hypothetical protein